MIAFPNSKINIGLNVINRRIDNYHNIETVFYPITIKDAIEVVESGELKFTSSGIEIPGEPEHNLCLKAYQLIAQDFKIPPVHIHLHKHIPIGAGLGGGSADAAFLIKLLNDKFSLKMNAGQMEAYAKQLGADCAFFIKNRSVYAIEKGDVFKDVSLDLKQYFLVLVMPPVQVSTKDAFENISIEPSGQLLDVDINLPIEQWKGLIFNKFEPSIFFKYPAIQSIKDDLYKNGALYASMSGSGASVYGIFENQVQLPELEVGNLVFYGV